VSVAGPPLVAPVGGAEWLRLARRARALSWVSLAWLGIEGTVAVLAGLAAGSVALVGFGLDSAIEALASVIVVWRFTGSRTTSAGSERRAARLVAISFLLLAPYVAVEAILALFTGRHPETSPVGIVLAIGSLAICPWLGLAKRRLGARLGSEATRGEGRQNLLCAGLAAAVLLGLAGNALAGLWWLDPTAALAIAAVAAVEGVRSWRGEACSCCAPVPATPAPPAASQLRVLRATPGGCSLDAPALEARATKFRALAERALVAAERTADGGLLVRYRRSPAVEAEVARLAALESDCCGSLRWRAGTVGDEVRLEVGGGPEAAPLLEALGSLAGAGPAV
jgi:hypothetical protein